MRLALFVALALVARCIATEVDVPNVSTESAPPPSEVAATAEVLGEPPTFTALEGEGKSRDLQTAVAITSSSSYTYTVKYSVTGNCPLVSYIQTTGGTSLYLYEKSCTSTTMTIYMYTSYAACMTFSLGSAYSTAVLDVGTYYLTNTNYIISPAGWTTCTGFISQGTWMNVYSVPSLYYTSCSTCTASSLPSFYTWCGSTDQYCATSSSGCSTAVQASGCSTLGSLCSSSGASSCGALPSSYTTCASCTSATYAYLVWCGGSDQKCVSSATECSAAVQASGCTTIGSLCSSSGASSCGALPSSYTTCASCTSATYAYFVWCGGPDQKCVSSATQCSAAVQASGCTTIGSLCSSYGASTCGATATSLTTCSSCTSASKTSYVWCGATDQYCATASTGCSSPVQSGSCYTYGTYCSTNGATTCTLPSPGLSVGAIVGIIIAALFVFIILPILIIVCFCGGFAIACARCCGSPKTVPVSSNPGPSVVVVGGGAPGGPGPAYYPQQQGYPPQGYPPQGYPPQGYPQSYPPQQPEHGGVTVIKA